ncbi:MAG: hypothetical protein J6Q65_05275, partial [Lentisphaeria bacterium]|nr:hypothetical protein [Lentisphaeria bacterium]
MKKSILFLMMLTVAAGAKDYSVTWIEPLDEQKKIVTEKLVPADEKLDPAKLPASTFNVDCNEYGIMITLKMDEKDAAARNELEVFFAPEGCSSYYQFYGFPFDGDMSFYPYGTYGRFYPRLNRKNWQISFQMTPAGMTMRIFIDWKDFARFTDAKKWKFGIFRNRNYVEMNWQGKLHQPATWGTIIFPDFTPEQKEAIAKRIVMDYTVDDTGFKFDPTRYNNKTFAAWRDMAKKEIAKLVKDDQITWRRKLETVLDLMEIRRYLDTNPHTIDPKRPAWTFYKGDEKLEKVDWRGPLQFNRKENVTRSIVYTAPAASEGEVWITNFVDYSNSQNVKWRVERNGSVILAGDSSMQPLNVKIGAMKKGESFRIVYEPNGTHYKPGTRFAVEDLKHGMIPGPAICVDYPAIDAPAPKRNPDGTVQT